MVYGFKGLELSYRDRDLTKGVDKASELIVMVM